MAAKDLDDKNLAHVSVFLFLRMNAQSIREFDSKPSNPGMGPQQLKELVYFNNAASQDVLKANAAVMAHLLCVFVTTYYTQQREKAYEKKSVPQIVAELTGLMIQPDKVVFDLATKVDGIFRFKSEGSAAVPLSEIVADVHVSAKTSKKLKDMEIT